MQSYLTLGTSHNFLSWFYVGISLFLTAASYEETLCYVVSFLFVVLFKMVAQKITVCPYQGDDIGNQHKFKPNTERHGFFTNECQYSTSFESGRHRSLKVRKESTGEQSNRSKYRRNNRITPIIARGHNQLFRGKVSSSP